MKTPKPTSTATSNIQNRKDLRKKNRDNKKPNKHKLPPPLPPPPVSTSSSSSSSSSSSAKTKKKQAKTKIKITASDDKEEDDEDAEGETKKYAHLPPETRLLLMRDDAEIAMLEAKLSKGSKGSKRSKSSGKGGKGSVGKEWDKEQGEGFGDFMEDLEGLDGRLFGDDDDDDDGRKKKVKKDDKKKKTTEKPYLTTEQKEAFARDDAEIAILQAKLSKGSKGNGSESGGKVDWDKEQGEGFGDFMEDLDLLEGRLFDGSDGDSDEDGSNGDSTSNSDSESDIESDMDLTDSDLEDVGGRESDFIDDGEEGMYGDSDDDDDDDEESDGEIAMKNGTDYKQPEDSDSESDSNDDDDDLDLSSSLSSTNSSPSPSPSSSPTNTPYTSQLDSESEDFSDTEGTPSQEDALIRSKPHTNTNTYNNKQSEILNEDSTYAPSKGEDIYGRKVEVSVGKKGGKYMTPVARARMTAAANSNSGDGEVSKSASEMALAITENEHDESHRLIRTLVPSIINKLTPSTLSSTITSLSNLLARPTLSSRVIVKVLIETFNISALDNELVLMDGLTVLLGGVVVGVHEGSLGVGVEVFEKVAERYLSLYAVEKGLVGNCVVGTKPDSAEFEDKERDTNKSLLNNLLLLLTLYNFSLLPPKFIFSHLHTLIASFTKLDVELILFICRTCETKIYRDDSEAFNQLAVVVRNKVKGTNGTNGTNGDGSSSSAGSRESYMISEIERIAYTKKGSNKGSKRSSAHSPQQSQSQSKQSLLKELTLQIQKSKKENAMHRQDRLGKKGGQVDVDGVSLINLTIGDVESAKVKGRWWRVGGVWRGEEEKERERKVGGCDADADDRSKSRKKKDKANINSNSTPDPDQALEQEQDPLLTLASTLHCSTPTRLKIFLILLTSSDYEQAHASLQRLSLKSRESREIIKVLLIVSTAEKKFNPYYCHLLKRVIEGDRSMKFTLKVCLWDVFKTMFSGAGSGSDGGEEMKAREVLNLSRLVLFFVMEGGNSDYLSLLVLKPIPFDGREEGDDFNKSSSSSSSANRDKMGGVLLGENTAMFLTSFFDAMLDKHTSHEIEYAFKALVKKTGKSTKGLGSGRDHDNDHDDDDDDMDKPNSKENEDNDSEEENNREDDKELLLKGIESVMLRYLKGGKKDVRGSEWRRGFKCVMKVCGGGGGGV